MNISENRGIPLIRMHDYELNRFLQVFSESKQGGNAAAAPVCELSQLKGGDLFCLSMKTPTLTKW